jgi:hypothetical protein
MIDTKTFRDAIAYCYATRSECTTREAHKNNFVARLVIRCNKIIGFPDILASLVRYRSMKKCDLSSLHQFQSQKAHQQLR